MKKKGMIIAFAFLGLLILAACSQTENADKKKNTIKVASMTSITDKKGNGLEKYRGKSARLFFDEKAKTVNYYGIRYVKESSKSIRAYYDIGHGGYVPADSVILINGKPAIALNNNSYVYNSKLKRTGKKYKVYQPLIYAGKIKYSSKEGKKDKWFYYSGNTKKPYAIPKVYKKKYLKIGKNRYIKAVNVFSIKREKLHVKGPITATVKQNMYSLDSRLYETNHLYKKGQKVKLDKCIIPGNGDNAVVYYRVAKTNEYLLWGDAGYLPETYYESTYSHNNLKIKQHMDAGDFLPGKTEYTAAKDRNVKKLQTYDLTGTAIKGKKILNLFVHVDGQAYLLNPQTKKIELFYHLQDQHLIGEFFWYETAADDEDFKATDQYNGFLKASEVKKAKLPTIISKKAAKTSDQPASASQLAALKKEIAKAEAVQKKTIYKLSSSYRRDYLDYALSNAQKALSGNKGEVTFAKWLLANSETYLNGKKAPVTNINKLSKAEYKRVWRIVSDATPNGYIPAVYYKRADGTWHRRYSYTWNNKTCKFVYVNKTTNEKKFLKISDFAKNSKL
ncbi:MAG: hypothetical protein ACI31N_06245 [Lacticaseibacillus absianus]